MNPANIVTIVRILLIPVFALLAVIYAKSITAGQPQEIYRWLALATFIIVATGDWLDGYLARKYGATKLGSYLDPLCDKVLMLVSLLVLSQYSWSNQGWIIPVWFVVMVVARDVSITLGCIFIYLTGKKVQVRSVIYIRLGHAKSISVLTNHSHYRSCSIYPMVIVVLCQRIIQTAPAQLNFNPQYHDLSSHRRKT